MTELSGPEVEKLQADAARDALELQAALGRMVQSWNEAESKLKDVLRALSGGGAAVDVLISRLGEHQMCDAIEAMVVHDLVPDISRAWILHAVKFFRLLRPWRNFYAHECRPTVAPLDGMKAYARGATFSAKKGYQPRVATVTKGELDRVTKWAGDLFLIAYFVVETIYEEGDILQAVGIVSDVPPPLPDEFKAPPGLLVAEIE